MNHAISRAVIQESQTVAWLKFLREHSDLLACVKIDVFAANAIFKAGFMEGAEFGSAALVEEVKRRTQK